MTGKLEQYVLEELPIDEAIVKDLNECIESSLDLFRNIEFLSSNLHTDQSASLWPYWVLDRDRRESRRLRTADARPSKRLSQSTTSMIISAISAATAPPSQRCSSGYFWHQIPMAERSALGSLDPRLRTAVRGLALQWTRPKHEETAITADTNCALSTTFGKNDILTLSWLLDIYSPNSKLSQYYEKGAPKVYKGATTALINRINKYVNAGSGYEAVIAAFNDDHEDPKRIVMDSAYNLLRFVRCFRVVEEYFSEDLARQKTFTRARDRAYFRFRSQLHDQLSYSAIVDSRFDPSELAFCLEGMLQLRGDSVDEALLCRVMDVMSKSQETAPYWHSEMPMLANHKGQVLYPSSVETASSLLASFSLCDHRDPRRVLHNSAGSRFIHLIKRYWIWLKTRRTRVSTENGTSVSGWHSEHLNDPAIIHTWETSQILEFLICFRDQLLRHIARKSLLASRLNVEWPTTKHTDWKQVVAKYEPVSSFSKPYHVYARLNDDFVLPHQSSRGEKPVWSALLYGPPGTGKSSLADNLAAHLGAPLITVTVSDFLAEGEGGMENRAKLIFDVLERQRHSVVLFDELDQFLLDRDSERFREQDSAFQFLTPGMLTKIAKLRRSVSVIFLIATNYEERIDPAIKRSGRIDRQYLVMPPDWRQRKAILASFPSVAKMIHSATKSDDSKLRGASAFLVFNDLKSVGERHHGSIDDLVEALALAPRNIQFFSYMDRFSLSADGRINLLQGPREELICVCRLAHEAWMDCDDGTETANAFRRAMKEVLVHASDPEEFKKQIFDVGAFDIEQLIYRRSS